MCFPKELIQQLILYVSCIDQAYQFPSMAVQRRKLPSVALLCCAGLWAVSQGHSGKLPNFPIGYFDQYHVSTFFNNMCGKCHMV